MKAKPPVKSVPRAKPAKAAIPAKSAARAKPVKSATAVTAAKPATPPGAKAVPFRWSSEGGWETKVPGSKLRERPGEFAGCRSKSAQTFVATLPADPMTRASEVMNLIDRANEGSIKKMDLDVKLALAWSMAVCAGLGWESIEVRDRAGRIGTGRIADSERRWVVDPRKLMRRLLGLEPKGACPDNTALLLFNMMAAGNLPPAKPGDYLPIG